MLIGSIPALVRQLPITLQLLNIMPLAIQLPLALNFLLASQAKAVQPFVDAYIVKYRLNHRHALAIDVSPLIAVYAMFHPVRIVRRSLVPQDERGDSTMPSVVVGGFGILHALLFKGAVPALQQASLKPDFGVSGLVGVLSATT